MMKDRGGLTAGGLMQPAWALTAIIASVVLAAVAAWPIYESPRVALVALAGLLIGVGAVLGRQDIELALVVGHRARVWWVRPDSGACSRCLQR